MLSGAAIPYKLYSPLYIQKAPLILQQPRTSLKGRSRPFKQFRVKPYMEAHTHTILAPSDVVKSAYNKTKLLFYEPHRTWGAGRSLSRGASSSGLGSHAALFPPMLLSQLSGVCRAVTLLQPRIALTSHARTQRTVGLELTWLARPRRGRPGGGRPRSSPRGCSARWSPHSRSP